MWLLGVFKMLITGPLRQESPRGGLVGPWMCVIQDAGLDGPSWVTSSRAEILMCSLVSSRLLGWGVGRRVSSTPTQSWRYSLHGWNQRGTFSSILVRQEALGATRAPPTPKAVESGMPLKTKRHVPF